MSGSDALREMASNRGCRLVRSRRRRPGGDFGRYGLKDKATGEERFGFSEKGLTATAEEIEAWLRSGAAAGWKGSLAGREERSKPARPPGKAKKAPEAKKESKARKAPGKKPKAGTEPPEKAAPRKPAVPDPEPSKLAIRDARPTDAPAIAALVGSLGYEVDQKGVRRALARLAKAGRPVLVADRDGLVGCLSWHVTDVLHRPRPVGRLTMLVVAEEARGEGVGTALVAAAEARLAEAGCGLVEVTSNRRRIRAHAFYDGLGYERTSFRFAKALKA